MRYTTLWPGLWSVWYQGSARGLLLAVLFSWAICFALLATFVWTQWVSGWLVAALWICLGCYWLFEWIRSQFAVASLSPSPSDEQNDTLEHAQREYLKGNWYDAEARLLDLLGHKPDDAAASLMLVGVLRHTKRWRAALRRLEQLSLTDAASPWLFEIRSEKLKIESAMKADTLTDETVATQTGAAQTVHGESVSSE